MSMRSAARTVAYTAAGAAVGTGLLAGALAGVIFGQAALVRRTIPSAQAPPPRADGRYGHGSGPPIRLVMLGDSSAAGYGVDKPRQTPGALLAAGLAARLNRPVRLWSFAVVGATSAMLAPQVEQAVEVQPDLAVILIGANDVTHRISPATATPHLVRAIQALRAVGTRVIVGTCPDLSTVQPVRPPLRWIARQLSRQMAMAQTIAAVNAGAVTVSLGDLLGPRFAADPVRLFSRDQFHPSAEGYAVAAAALLPTLVAVFTEETGATPTGAPEPRREGVRGLSRAASQAARQPGTEIVQTQVAGRERGPVDRWVRLRQWAHSAIQPADPATTSSSTMETA